MSEGCESRIKFFQLIVLFDHPITSNHIRFANGWFQKGACDEGGQCVFEIPCLNRGRRSVEPAVYFVN